MKISVIIPVYNRRTTIERALRSVLQQSEAAHEIIVVDDGSTDETAGLLQKFSDQITLIHQDNKGVAAARNRGICSASGDWLAFLDSDDQWLPHKLRQARQFHQQNPHYLVFQSEEIWVRHGRRVNPKKKHRKKAGWIFADALPLCIISPSAVVMNRALFDEVGKFDETLPVCEDYDLWLRITRRYPVGLDPRPGIIKYGGHADQLSRSYPLMDLYRVRALEKQLADELLPDRQRRLVLETMVKKLAIVVGGARKRGRQPDELEEKLKFYRSQLVNYSEAAPAGSASRK